MEVLDGILSTGESSRLHQSLVYRDQIAAQAELVHRHQAGPRQPRRLCDPRASGKSAEEGEAALRREIARFRDEPVTAAELPGGQERIADQRRCAARETAEGQAEAIAEAVIVDGDARAADRRLAEIAAVTPADIQRVARRWLRDEASGAVRYLPEEARNGATGDTIAHRRHRRRRAADRRPPISRSSQPAPEAERVAPPPPGPEIVPPVPTPNVQRLANGLTVITVAEPPAAAGQRLAGLAAAAPPTTATAAPAPPALTAAVMTEGTRPARRRADRPRGRGARRLARRQCRLGRRPARHHRPHRRARHRRSRIIADVARNATLAGEELERQRAIAVDAVAVSMRDPGDVAGLAAMRALYGAVALRPSGGRHRRVAARHHPRRHPGRLSRRPGGPATRP